jgi:hypothetical protein|tara:strand:+ start:180 stop:326 length:147 start_codon:yes stop_codon:yes gene_type:complete
MVYYGYSWDTMDKSSAMAILTKYKVLDTHPYMEYNGAYDKLQTNDTRG